MRASLLSFRKEETEALSNFYSFPTRVTISGHKGTEKQLSSLWSISFPRRSFVYVSQNTQVVHCTCVLNALIAAFTANLLSFLFPDFKSGLFYYSSIAVPPISDGATFKGLGIYATSLLDDKTLIHSVSQKETKRMKHTETRTKIKKDRKTNNQER